MRNTLKILVSISLFTILAIGVTGYYCQIHAKSSISRWSSFSDNNEEDLLKEDFIKNVIFEEQYSEYLFVFVSPNILFPHPPYCIVEGHTGLVTPPPWS